MFGHYTIIRRGTLLCLKALTVGALAFAGYQYYKSHKSGIDQRVQDLANQVEELAGKAKDKAEETVEDVKETAEKAKSKATAAK